MGLRFSGDFFWGREIILLSLKLEKACVPLSEALSLSDEKKHSPHATLPAPNHQSEGEWAVRRMGSQVCIWGCSRLLPVVCALLWVSTEHSAYYVGDRGFMGALHLGPS